MICSQFFGVGLGETPVGSVHGGESLDAVLAAIASASQIGSGFIGLGGGSTTSVGIGAAQRRAIPVVPTAPIPAPTPTPHVMPTTARQPMGSPAPLASSALQAIPVQPNVTTNFWLGYQFPAPQPLSGAEQSIVLRAQEAGKLIGHTTQILRIAACVASALDLSFAQLCLDAVLLHELGHDLSQWLIRYLRGSNEVVPTAALDPPLPVGPRISGACSSCDVIDEESLPTR